MNLNIKTAQVSKHIPQEGHLKQLKRNSSQTKLGFWNPLQRYDICYTSNYGENGQFVTWQQLGASNHVDMEDLLKLNVKKNVDFKGQMLI